MAVLISHCEALIMTPAVASSDSIETRSVSEECSELQPHPRLRFGFRCRSYDQGSLVFAFALLFLLKLLASHERLPLISGNTPAIHWRLPFELEPTREHLRRA